MEGWGWYEAWQRVLWNRGPWEQEDPPCVGRVSDISSSCRLVTEGLGKQKTTPSPAARATKEPMGSWTNWRRTRFPVPGPSDGRLLPGAELFQRKRPRVVPLTTHCYHRQVQHRWPLHRPGPWPTPTAEEGRASPSERPMAWQETRRSSALLWPDCLGPQHSEAPSYNFTQARTPCEGTRPNSRRGTAVLRGRATANAAAGLSFWDVHAGAHTVRTQALRKARTHTRAHACIWRTRRCQRICLRAAKA